MPAGLAERRFGDATTQPRATRPRVFVNALLAGALCLAPPAIAPSGAESAPPGKQVFTQLAQPACAACHALHDAGSTADVGPALDELRPDAARVARAVRNGVGVMPSYVDKLTDDEIRAVAEYVAEVTGSAR